MGSAKGTNYTQCFLQAERLTKPVHEDIITRLSGFPGVLLQIRIRGYQACRWEPNQFSSTNIFLLGIIPKKNVDYYFGNIQITYKIHWTS